MSSKHNWSTKTIYNNTLNAILNGDMYGSSCVWTQTDAYSYPFYPNLLWSQAEWYTHGDQVMSSHNKQDDLHTCLTTWLLSMVVRDPFECSILPEPIVKFCKTKWLNWESNSHDCDSRFEMMSKYATRFSWTFLHKCWSSDICGQNVQPTHWSHKTAQCLKTQSSSIQALKVDHWKVNILLNSLIVFLFVSVDLVFDMHSRSISRSFVLSPELDPCIH